MDLAFELKTTGAHSVPVNFLVPIDGTPLATLEVALTPRYCLKVLAMMREDERRQMRKRIEGLRLGGLITGAVGGGTSTAAPRRARPRLPPRARALLARHARAVLATRAASLRDE